MDIFDDGKESFEDLPFGHHKVTLAVLERNGEQYIKDTDKGPRVTFKLSSVNGGGSVLTGQTFNGKAAGLLSGINACMGFSKEQANELVTVAPTDTTFHMGSLHCLTALWASSAGGWVEVTPGKDPKYPEVRFLKFKDGAPKTVKTAADYRQTTGADLI